MSVQLAGMSRGSIGGQGWGGELASQKPSSVSWAPRWGSREQHPAPLIRAPLWLCAQHMKWWGWPCPWQPLFGASPRAPDAVSSWYGDFTELGPFCSPGFFIIFKVSTCYLPPFYRLERVLNCNHTQPARLTLPKASRPTSFLPVIRLRHSEWLMAVYSSQ